MPEGRNDFTKRGSIQSVGARRRGRPPGSKNRPKAVLAMATVRSFRDKVGPYLSPEDGDYLMAVLTGKREPELQKDMDIFLALQLKALLPLLAEEIDSGQLSKEGTARSSLVKELLALRFNMEKHDKGEKDANQYTFIQNIFQARGIDADRIAALVVGPDGGPRELPSGLPGDADRDEEPADEARAVSGEVPQRPE